MRDTVDWEVMGVAHHEIGEDQRTAMVEMSVISMVGGRRCTMTQAHDGRHVTVMHDEPACALCAINRRAHDESAPIM